MKNSIDNNFALRAAYYENYNQCIQTLVDFLYFAPNNIDTTYDYKRTIASRKLDFASQMIDSIDGWDIVAADGRTLEEIYNDALRDAYNKFYEKKKEVEENKPQESTGSSGNGGYYYWHYGIGDDIYDANLYDDGDDFADD